MGHYSSLSIAMTRSNEMEMNGSFLVFHCHIIVAFASVIIIILLCNLCDVIEYLLPFLFTGSLQ